MTGALAMDTPPDVTALLGPISSASPAGEWLLYEGTYDKIREARRAEDASLPQGVWQRDLKRANWAEVQELATTALVRKSKDLQIAAWLMEAWTQLRGFEGTRRGLELLFEISERYWDTLYPLPDGTDYSARSLVISWVNDRFGAMLRGIPLTQPGTADGKVWTWTQREEALRAENLVLRGKTAPGPNDGEVLTSAKMFAGVAATPRWFYQAYYEHLGSAIVIARAIQSLFDERCGAEAPSLSILITVLETLEEWVKGVLAQQLADIPASARESAAAPVNGAHKAADPSPDVAAPEAALPIGDHARARADAYRKLAESAHTLMRIEPHSPTPYLVFRAIAWGEMSLAELMRHFISSGYDLKSLYSMLGMDDQGAGR